MRRPSHELRPRVVRLTGVGDEIFRATRARGAQSLALAFLAAAATCAIVLTSGRSAGLERAVLSAIDEQGPRTVTVQATKPLGEFNTRLVDRLSAIQHIESMVGFGGARDATLAAVPSGPRVAVRAMYVPLQGDGPVESASAPDSARLSKRAAEELGLDSIGGTIRIIDGPELQIQGLANVPGFLRPLEPLAVVDRSGAEIEPLMSVHILVASTRDLPLVLRQIESFLADFDPSDVKVSTSSQLAELKDVIGNNLTSRNRSTLLAITGVGAVLIATATLGFVMNQRRSYGRRRALGASRSLLLVLVVGQVGLGVSFGAAVGVVGGAVWLWIEGNPLPSYTYLAALAVLVSAVSVMAALIPGWFAAQRDPVRELRVP